MIADRTEPPFAPAGGAVVALEHRPLVSVVIPARDAAGTIARALSSVLAQEWRPLEVIVVDDASRDRTAAIVEDFAAAAGSVTIRLLRHAVARGAAGARNAGIAAASGEIIAFQDADDEWLPDKLARQVERLRADPGVLFVACGARLIAATGEDVGALYDGQTPPEGAAAWRALLARNTIATPSVIAWKRELQALGGFDTSLRIAEDQDMWIRLAMRGRLGFVDAPLVRVHVTADSLSSIGSRRGYQDQLRFTLPMVQRYVTMKRGELAPREVRRILGERWGRLGRAAYTYRVYGAGLGMVLHAMLLGYRPLENLLFLVSAAPPTRWLKRRIGIGRA
jgi:glycosyltransferase involved in cell wall biosynthesis